MTAISYTSYYPREGGKFMLFNTPRLLGLLDQGKVLYKQRAGSYLLTCLACTSVLTPDLSEYLGTADVDKVTHYCNTP